MQKNKAVAVFFGGNSYERDISVVTGVLACNLLRSRYRVFPVYLSPENECFTSEAMFDIKSFRSVKTDGWQKVVLLGGGLYAGEKKLKKVERIDCVLNCCHGGWGEGGGLASLCRLYALPFASPQAEVSALFLDKGYAKAAAQAAGIPVIPFRSATLFDYRRDAEGVKKDLSSLGYPLILKPARLGSSIGIRKVEEEGALPAALESCFAFDDKVLAERYLTEKTDAACAAYLLDGNIVLSPARALFQGEGVYTFEEKYAPRGETPRGVLSKEVEAQIRALTESLYGAFSLSGIVRADFLVSGGAVYFNELNTVPGSLAYGMFTDKLTEQRDILCSLIEEAMARGNGEKKAEIITDILNKKEIIFSSGCKTRGNLV